MKLVVCCFKLVIMKLFYLFIFAYCTNGRAEKGIKHQVLEQYFSKQYF